MGITIKQIAELSGVSRGTVDRVINNRKGVRQEVREKILKIIDEKGYTPNILGKALANKQYSTRKIGIILNSIDNPFYIDVINGIKDKFEFIKKFGFEIDMIHKKGYEVEEQVKAIDEMLDKNISGLIISPINDEKVILKLKELEKNNIPIVNINIDVEISERLAYIGSDYYNTGKVAASIFAMIGNNQKQKIAIVTGSNLVLGHNLRIKGFKDYISEKKSNIDIVDIVENQDNDELSYEVVNKLLDKDLDGIFFCAAGIKGGIDAISKRKMLKKIKILTVDLTPIVRKNLKNENIIATICQQPYRQGVEALDILFEYLMSNKKPVNKIINTDIEIKMKYSI